MRYDRQTIIVFRTVGLSTEKRVRQFNGLTGLGRHRALRRLPRPFRTEAPVTYAGKSAASTMAARFAVAVNEWVDRLRIMNPFVRNIGRPCVCDFCR